MNEGFDKWISGYRVDDDRKHERRIGWQACAAIKDAEISELIDMGIRLEEEVEVDMLSDRQMHLIKQAKELGFGYSIFASNVERQGFCSQKQETALDNMVSAGKYRKNNWKPSCGGRKPRRYKCDISDSEAMQSGDYF